MWTYIDNLWAIADSVRYEAMLADVSDRKAVEVRSERNAKIAACDWRVLPDVSNSDVWKTYRQTLRDIPAQAGFPNNVTWPDAP